MPPTRNAPLFSLGSELARTASSPRARGWATTLALLVILLTASMAGAADPTPAVPTIPAVPAAPAAAAKAAAVAPARAAADAARAKASANTDAAKKAAAVAPAKPATDAAKAAAMAVPAKAAANVNAGAVDLGAELRSVFSQFGEDGVVEKIFELIPPTTKYVVEFGAYDGVHNSNSRNLILNHGWGGLQMEGHPKRAASMVELYKDNPKVTAKHAWIWPGNIEVLFEDNNVPRDFDLLVVDIDSNDYYVWKAINNYRPKVVMIESNPWFLPPQKALIDFHPMNYWDQTNYAGASIQTFYELAKSKGYELVYVMQEGANLFFVDKQYFPKFGIKDNSPVVMWHERAMPNKELTDYPEGKEALHIDAFEIPKVWRFDR